MAQLDKSGGRKALANGRINVSYANYERHNIRGRHAVLTIGNHLDGPAYHVRVPFMQIPALVKDLLDCYENPEHQPK